MDSSGFASEVAGVVGIAVIAWTVIVFILGYEAHNIVSYVGSHLHIIWK